MKNLSFMLLLWVVAACTPSSKPEEIEVQKPNPAVFFKAKMNGNLWEAPRILTSKTNNETMLSIYGRQPENGISARLICFRIPLSAVANDKIEIVGGVNCQSNQSFASVIDDTPEKTFTNFESQAGEIVIKKHDGVAKHVEGSFHFTAKGSNGIMTISEGAFSVDY
jgi:Family of unknown function (DUF6252)